jgi:hypothetical protein
VPLIQAALNLDGHDIQYARRSMAHGRAQSSS